jgi:fructokinase
VSDEDLEYLQPGEEPIVTARTLLEVGPRAVLLTAGGVGVTVMTAQGEVIVDIQPVAVVDTIGAGDSFSAGFVTWWSESGGGRDGVGSLDRLVPAVEAATAVAGVVCTRRGADPPWRSELSGAWASP